MLLSLWLCIPVLFWVAYYSLTKGRLTRHVGFLHYVIFFFSIYFGSLSMYYAGGGVNHWYLASVMFYPILGLGGMLVGTIVGGHTYFPLIERLRMKRWQVRLVALTTMTFLAVYAVYLYLYASNIPLWVLLTSGDAAEGRVARYVATKGYAETVGGLGLLVWFPRIFIDYYAEFLVAFAYLHARRRLLSRVRFGLIVAGVLLISVFDTQKYPALKLIVVLALCIYNSTHKKVDLRSIYPAVKMAVLATLVVGVIYGVVSGQGTKLYEEGIYSDVSTAMEFGWSMMTTRGIVGQTRPLSTTFELIPQQYDYFGGRTLTNPRGILPYTPVQLPYLICETYESGDSGFRCGAPTVFFGEVYANFGVAIAWMSMFIFGFVLQVINSKLSGNIGQLRTPFSIAFFYLVMTFVADYAISFSTPYFDERVWFIAAYWLSQRFWRKDRCAEVTEAVEARA